MDCVADNPNIARAIRRSRAARSAIESRRRRRIAIAGAAALTLSAGTAFTASGLVGSFPVQAAINQAKSLADLLQQRSPGERTQGVLTKAKRAQRALAKMRPAINPEIGGQPPSATELATILLPPAEAPLPVAVGSPLAMAQLPSTPFDSITGPGPGLVITGPGGGSGSPGGGGGSPPIVTPQNPGVPSAVPEPGTWATMLLGFALIGWRVKRGGNKTAQPLHA